MWVTYIEPRANKYRMVFFVVEGKPVVAITALKAWFPMNISTFVNQTCDVPNSASSISNDGGSIISRHSTGFRLLGSSFAPEVLASFLPSCLSRIKSNKKPWRTKWLLFQNQVLDQERPFCTRTLCFARPSNQLHCKNCCCQITNDIFDHFVLDCWICSCSCKNGR